MCFDIDEDRRKWQEFINSSPTRIMVDPCFLYESEEVDRNIMEIKYGKYPITVIINPNDYNKCIVYEILYKLQKEIKDCINAGIEIRFNHAILYDMKNRKRIGVKYYDR